MKAGRDLDALVAEKVMGCKVAKILDYGIKPGHHRFRCDCPGPNSTDDRPHADQNSFDGDLKEYSTDIAAAWAVLEKFTTNYSTSREPFGYGIKIEHRTEGVGEKWFVTGVWTACCPEYENMDEEKFTVEAETAPLAICLAALKAVGVNV